MTVRFNVQEQKEKSVLNTPGGPELMKRLGGPAGLPFFAVLKSDGMMAANSLRPDKTGKGVNIGFPVDPAEVDWFVAMLSKAAPDMTAQELAAISRGLRTKK